MPWFRHGFSTERTAAFPIFGQVGIIFLGFSFIGSVFSAERMRQGIQAHGLVQLKDLQVMSPDTVATYAE